MIDNRKISELQKHEIYILLERRRKRKLGREEEKKTRKQNSSNTGKKNDHVRNRERQNEQLMKEFVREGLGHHTKKDKQHRVGPAHDPLDSNSWVSVWILCWRLAKGWVSALILDSTKGLQGVRHDCAQHSQVYLGLYKASGEEGMAAHSSILAWRILWTEEPDRLQSMGS